MLLVKLAGAGSSSLSESMHTVLFPPCSFNSRSFNSLLALPESSHLTRILYKKALYIDTFPSRITSYLATMRLELSILLGLAMSVKAGWLVSAYPTLECMGGVDEIGGQGNLGCQPLPEGTVSAQVDLDHGSYVRLYADTECKTLINEARYGGLCYTTYYRTDGLHYRGVIGYW